MSVDRLCHKAFMVNMTGPSYRVKELSEHHSVEDARHHIQHDEYGNLTPVFYEIRGCMAQFFAKVMYPEETI